MDARQTNMTETFPRSYGAVTGLILLASVDIGAQSSESPNATADPKAMVRHMEMTSPRPSNTADSLRAAKLVTTLRSSIAKYRDVKLAVDDGDKQFTIWGDDHDMAGDEMMDHRH